MSAPGASDELSEQPSHLPHGSHGACSRSLIDRPNTQLRDAVSCHFAMPRAKENRRSFLRAAAVARRRCLRICILIA